MQRPSALALFLCDQVIFDRDTSKPSVIGIFSRQESAQFPFVPSPFDVFASLTDGQGRIQLEVIVTSLQSEELISSMSREFDFPNPLAILNLRFRVQGLSFPSPGVYLFELHANGEAIAHRRLSLFQGGSS